MLNQAAHDIYNAAAEKTEDELLEGGKIPRFYLKRALHKAENYLSWDLQHKFDIWIKAVADLTAIHRAERK